MIHTNLDRAIMLFLRCTYIDGHSSLILFYKILKSLDSRWDYSKSIYSNLFRINWHRGLTTPKYMFDFVVAFGYRTDTNIKPHMIVELSNRWQKFYTKNGICSKFCKRCGNYVIDKI